MIFLGKKLQRNSWILFMKHKRIADIPVSRAHNSVNRKALITVGELNSKMQTINYAWLEKNEGFEPHTHTDCEEVYYFLEGQGVMEINSRELVVNEGDLVVVEANEPHGLHNNQEQLLKFLTIRVLI